MAREQQRVLREAYAALSRASVVQVASDDFRPRTKHVVAAHAPAAMTERQRQTLGSAFSDFLHNRFAAAPDEYASWRKQQGYTIASPDHLRDRALVHMKYERYFRKPLPPDMPLLTAHTECIAASDAEQGGRNRITGISLADSAVSVVSTVLNRTHPLWPLIPGTTGHALHSSMAIATSWPWWAHGADLDRQFESDGEALVSLVAFVAEFGDGRRRPAAVHFVWDARSEMWIIIRISVGSPDRTPPGIDY